MTSLLLLLLFCEVFIVYSSKVELIIVEVFAIVICQAGLHANRFINASRLLMFIIGDQPTIISTRCLTF